MVTWGGLIQAIPPELVEEIGTLVAAMAILASAAGAMIHWRLRLPRPPAVPMPAPVREPGALDVVQTLELAEIRRDMGDMRTEFRAALTGLKTMLEAVHDVTHAKDDELAVPRVWTMMPQQRAGLTYLSNEVAAFREEVTKGLEDLQQRLDEAAS